MVADFIITRFRGKPIIGQMNPMPVVMAHIIFILGFPRMLSDEL